MGSDLAQLRKVPSIAAKTAGQIRSLIESDYRAFVA